MPVSPSRLLPVLAGMLAGCNLMGTSQNGGPLAACPTTTDDVQAQILRPGCAFGNCHTGAHPAAGLDLAAAGLETRLVGVAANACGDKTLIVAGDPARSYVLEKLSVAEPSCGERMPLGLTPLPAEQMTCLEQWVSALPPPQGSPDAGTGGGDAGPACPAGQLSCGGGCTDVGTDNGNCGDCGHACTAGTSCVGGQCACPGSLALCDGACVDTQTSATSCGGCGQSCGTGQTCSGGGCVCQSGLTLCSGACVDLQSSAANCGACGRACGSVCSSGRCVQSCPAETSNCSGSCVNLQTSSSNCGACGNACGPGLGCTNGACSCPTAGTVLCGSTCVNTALDPSNCGVCGRACPAGTTCSAGACACASSQTLCGTMCVNTSSDPANCGACGRACPAGQTCTGGSCGCGPSVSFAAQVQPIFTANCTMACHSGMRPSASMSLVSGAAFGALVNVASSTCSGRLRVKPGAPGASYLMNKLYGTDLCSGSQMPKAGGALPAAQLALINGWICEGAPNN